MGHTAYIYIGIVDRYSVENWSTHRMWPPTVGSRAPNMQISNHGCHSLFPTRRPASFVLLLIIHSFHHIWLGMKKILRFIYVLSSVSLEANFFTLFSVSCYINSSRAQGIQISNHRCHSLFRFFCCSSFTVFITFG